MGSTFGIYKKLFLNFRVLEGTELLPILAELPHKYAGARREGRHALKYYRQGYKLMRMDEFVAEHGRETSYRPNAYFVLLLSMNRATIANGTSVIKSRNKVQLIIPIEITSVRDGSAIYPNPGLSIDPHMLDGISLTLNILAGTGEYAVHVAETRDYVENPDDIVSAIKVVLDPIIEKMEITLGESVVAVWQTETGETMMLNYIEEMLFKVGLRNPLVEKSRLKLASRLMEGLALAAVEEDDVQWDNPTDKAYDLKEAGGNMELAKTRRRAMIRMKFLLDECSFEQRLLEMTRAEIENTIDLNTPNITMAMTDEEVTEWFAGEDTSELEFKVLDRYLKARK
jgi:hypothetical protein